MIHFSRNINFSIIAILFFFQPINLHSQEKHIGKILKLGDSLIANNELDKAIILFNNAIDEFKKEKLTASLVEVFIRKAEISVMKTKNSNEAISTLKLLETHCVNSNNKKCLISTYIQLSYYLSYNTDYIKSLEYSDKATVLLKDVDDWYLQWKLFNTKGQILSELGYRDQATLYHRKALKTTKLKDSLLRRSASYVNISDSMVDKDSALYYANKALDFCNKEKKSRICLIAMANKAIAYIKKEEYDEALRIIYEDIDFENLKYSVKDSLYESVLQLLGVIYYHKNDLKTSIHYLELSLDNFKKRNNATELISIYEDLSRSYEKAGNFEKSIKLLKESKIILKELTEIKLEREIAKLEVKRLLTIKEAKILNLEERNSKIDSSFNMVRLLSYIMAILLVIILSVFTTYYFRNKLRHYQLNEELSKTRFKSLRSAMNPHFLFNSFSTLQNYILKKENLRANEYMTELSGLIRNILASSDSIYINLKEELQILNSYITIEKERFNESFSYIFKIDNELLELNPKIPSMIIQPYIENAIIHGFSGSKEQKCLQLSFERKGQRMLCYIEDNGIGRKTASENKSKKSYTQHLSIATKNIDERLQILSKLGNGKAEVTIEDLINEEKQNIGTKVLISLPIIS